MLINIFLFLHNYFDSSYNDIMIILEKNNIASYLSNEINYLNIFINLFLIFYINFNN